MRQVGQKKDNYDDETTAEVLKKCKSLFRTDWGGKDPIKQVQRIFSLGGIKCGEKSAAIVVEICKSQIESTKKRAFPRIDEVIDRVSHDAVESLP
jgi:hypothetical protein